MTYYYRRKHGWLGLALILFSWLVFYGQQNGWFNSADQSLQSKQPGYYTVSHFVDGDTIGVDMDGHEEKVRFVGVDTPETHKPNTPVQCYGPAAAAFTKNTIGSNRVKLVSDSLSTNRDRYNRLLRYVYLPDGTLVNEKIIQNGFGFYYPYFPFSMSAKFAADQQQAQVAHKGLWGNCSPTPTDGGGWLSNPA
jgi:endonuclease YncB( thermonuclease family)